ncbi:Apc13p protein-domain-containing protein [Nemania abortiva]|nr:Apc13p protein-domain-containing protein [Nemania abortiva]
MSAEQRYYQPLSLKLLRDKPGQLLSFVVYVGNTQNNNHDGCYTYIHMQRPRDADLFEDFNKDQLPDDEIYVPPQHQPINPEDEDDVVPDQHAAFGIQKATQRNKEPAWKDLNLAALMKQGPTPGRAGGAASAAKNPYRGLPR